MRRSTLSCALGSAWRPFQHGRHFRESDLMIAAALKRSGAAVFAQRAILAKSAKEGIKCSPSLANALGVSAATKLSGGTAVEPVPPLDVLMVAERQFRRPAKDLHGKQSHCVARIRRRRCPAATEAGMRIAQIAPLFESVPSTSCWRSTRTPSGPASSNVSPRGAWASDYVKGGVTILRGHTAPEIRLSPVAALPAAKAGARAHRSKTAMRNEP